MRIPALLLLLTTGGVSAFGASILDVGHFNVVTFGDFSSTSDVNGRVAIGGNLTSNLTVGGSEISRFGDYDYTTVVAGSIGGNRIQQNTGGDVYARNANKNNITIQNGTGDKITHGPSPINFHHVEAAAKSMSWLLSHSSAYTPTGSTDIVLDTAGRQDNLLPSVQVFRLTSDQFSNLKSINTHGKIVIIDVMGTSVSTGFSNYFVDGLQATAGSWAASNILFNFRSAQSITINTGFYGSILAPSATLRGNHQLNGQFIVNALQYQGQIHGTPFGGPLPSQVPEPGTALSFVTAAAAMGVIYKVRRSQNRVE